MGKPTGFMEFMRIKEASLLVADRRKNYHEFVLHLNDEQAKIQGARCMDCGIPFCTTGCPVNNIIPDWNDLVYRGNWRASVTASRCSRRTAASAVCCATASRISSSTSA